MASRLNLHKKFEEILGSKSVYFQPPASVKMQYPAIVYKRKDVDTRFANGGVYGMTPVYEVILIDKNPDSSFVEAILRLPYCSFDRHYESDNLNHDAFTIYDN